MSRPPSAEQAERALRRVSQLRALFLRLAHLPTPREQQLLEEFGAFLAQRQPSLSLPAARVGMRACWRAGTPKDILAVAHRLGEERVASDRTLLTYVTLAQEVLSRS
jgi:hypothetical protein